MHKTQNRRRPGLATEPRVPSDATRLPMKGVAMPRVEPDNELRRTVEALAQALYEAEDPGGIAWAKRSQTVREPWLLRARRQLQTST